MIMRFYDRVRAWARREQGATAIEYGLIAGGISIAIVAAVLLAGDSLVTIFEGLVTAISDALSNL